MADESANALPTTGEPMTDILTDESRPTPALQFRGVSMTFPDGTHALDETSFDVHPGEFVTVVGPSGCGKSTLLRIASGLTHPTTGWVTVERAGIGYVFQDATLLPWRTVMGNVELLAELEGLSKDETRRRPRRTSTSSGWPVTRRSTRGRCRVA